MVAARLAAAQAALGCRTAVVAYEFPHAQVNVATALSKVPQMDRVKLHYLPPLSRVERFLARGGKERLKPLIADADLVHLHGVWDPLIYRAAGVARENRKPYVLTPHGMLDPWSVAQKAWKKKIALNLGYRRMLNYAAFLHYLNGEEQELTKPLRLTSRGEVLPNGIFLEEIDPLPARGTFRAARPEVGDRPFVLFLSRLHYKKGLDYLADAMAIAMKRFAELQLVVAGPDDGARAAFEEQIRRLGISDRVHLIGPVYGAAKLAALVDCDCFCLPSRQEGFSLAITEAMACEAPVVISQACHFPEVAEANAGIVCELNAAAVAAGLETILANQTASRQMGRRGRELVVSRYTWPAVTKQMLAAYERAV